jgi:hypothetical protein
MTSTFLKRGMPAESRPQEARIASAMFNAARLTGGVILAEGGRLDGQGHFEPEGRSAALFACHSDFSAHEADQLG